MDFSSLTEAQRQQLQQLQAQYQEHQAQQHQKQQDEAAAAAAAAQQAQQYQDYVSQQQSYDPSQVQSYDPSQAQSYDQSYYSYYPYQDPHQAHHAQFAQQDQQPHQFAAYYNTDYANAYQPQQQPQQQPHYSQAETASYHPPGVHVSREGPPPQGQVVEQRRDAVAVGLGQGQVQVQHQQNAYYPSNNGSIQVGPGGDQSDLGFNVPNGLNSAAAAAVAALSQLTQFAGTMDAAERAMVGSQEGQWYGNGGGHGSPMGPGPGFMGSMHQGRGHMLPPVGRSPYRGGGRRGGGPFKGGRGNFGNPLPNTSGSGPPFRGGGRGRSRGGRHYQPHSASSSSLPEGASANGGEGPSVDTTEAAQADVPNQQPIRIAWCELCRVDCTSLEILEQHKNGKRHKKNLQRLGGMKSSHEPAAEVQKDEKVIADSNAEVPENVQQDEGEKPENVPTEVGTDENKAENEQDDDGETKPWRQGMKRKMRGGRGGKRVKTFGGPSRRAPGPPKPKTVIPLICDLCNVKCDTKEVFDRHVAGKKHIAKLKRFEGHQAMYGPTGVQALYPPNPIAQALVRPQGSQQAFYCPPQGSYPPPETYIPPQAQNPNPQLSDAPLEFGNQNNVPGGQQPPASVELGTKL